MGTERDSCFAVQQLLGKRYCIRKTCPKVAELWRATLSRQLRFEPFQIFHLKVPRLFRLFVVQYMFSDGTRSHCSSVKRVASLDFSLLKVLSSRALRLCYTQRKGRERLTLKHFIHISVIHARFFSRPTRVTRKSLPSFFFLLPELSQITKTAFTVSRAQAHTSQLSQVGHTAYPFSIPRKSKRQSLFHSQ